MEVDEVPQQQSGLHRQYSPHQKRGYSYLFDMSTDDIAPNLIKQILNITWRQMGHRPASRIIMYKSADESRRQTTMTI